MPISMPASRAARPAAVIFDLAHVQAEIPTPDDGATAFRTSLPLSQVETGQVGVGTGARWGGMMGEEASRQGGLALAQIAIAAGTVTALVVVNAFGVVLPETDPRPLALDAISTQPPFGQSTTLMAVMTDAVCGHDVLTRMCVAAHDALARTIWPSHTVADGDVAFASTVNEGMTDPTTILPLTIATELAIEKAIQAAAKV